jgi:hypothetical protein
MSSSYYYDELRHCVYHQTGIPLKEIKCALGRTWAEVQDTGAEAFERVCERCAADARRLVDEPPAVIAAYVLERGSSCIAALLGAAPAHIPGSVRRK